VRIVIAVLTDERCEPGHLVEPVAGPRIPLAGRPGTSEAICAGRQLLGDAGHRQPPSRTRPAPAEPKLRSYAASTPLARHRRRRRRRPRREGDRMVREGVATPTARTVGSMHAEATDGCWTGYLYELVETVSTELGPGVTLSLPSRPQRDAATRLDPLRATRQRHQCPRRWPRPCERMAAAQAGGPL
jgi:hypothetical protein